MKKLIIICAAFLMTASVLAQAPEKMSYQAVVRDGSNALVTSTAVGMQISVLKGSLGGIAVYVETQTPTTNANGLVSLEIGAGTVVKGDFTTIDWSADSYFIKTETDPTGGIIYTVTGTSQLLSVPYALHAKTAESITGTVNYTETDPIFGASLASGITGTDTTYWNNKLTTEVDGSVTNEIELPTTANSGDMNYWNGSAWVVLAATPNEGAALQMIGGVPSWVGGTSPYPAGSVFCTSGATAIVDVTNPATGEIWMDRNLGATQAATSSTDVDAYGDLYQWGRFSDGHQCRTSATNPMQSSTYQPAHGDFITINSGTSDWLSPQNDNLWQGVNGTNNPCPSGYRIPTRAELNSETSTWSERTSVGAFDSALKLPLSGSRKKSDGSLELFNTAGIYWSSSVASYPDGTAVSSILGFDSSSLYIFKDIRARGLSVRCLKD
jgi:uncharacterized protein (TIGR02145 family)